MPRLPQDVTEARCGEDDSFLTESDPRGALISVGFSPMAKSTTLPIVQSLARELDVGRAVIATSYVVGRREIECAAPARSI